MADVYAPPFGAYLTASTAQSATANYKSYAGVEIGKLIALIPDMPDTNAERENPAASPSPYFGMMSPALAQGLRTELTRLRSCLIGGA